MPQTSSTIPASRHPLISRLPIEEHAAVYYSIDYWARGCGLAPKRLRTLTTDAIRKRHEKFGVAAKVRDGGRSLQLFELSIGSFSVIYSVEFRSVLVRGYRFPVFGGALDDHDNLGGFFVSTS